MRIFQGIIILLLALSLSACIDSSPELVPVEDATSIDRIPANGIYHVRAGESLYAIAWRYGLDYRDLVLRNGLSPSAQTYPGQIIYLRGRAPIVNVSPQTIPFTAEFSPEVPRQTISKNYFEPAEEPRAAVGAWYWPAKGRVTGGFSATNKGINISGKMGEPIYACAAGKVVYSGHGLRGYGNLIIIKHNSTFLTAYAHNRKNRVSEGEWVKIGQIIAEMGNTSARQVMLHFEIRREGIPVDPLNYLTNR